MENDINQCIFCEKQSQEAILIDMATNSIVLEDEIIEFFEIIKNLMFLKVQNESSACICEECKNNLVQFYTFKEHAKKNLIEIENVKKVLNFLDENEDQEVFCTRYNKCLTLVPESRRKMSEVFQHWQPQVVMEKIEDFQQRQEEVEKDEESPEPLGPPPKKQKIEENIEKVSMNVKTIEDIFIPTHQEEVEEVKVVSDEGITENEWVQMEIDNSELIETELGTEWLCRYCEPGPVTFIDLVDYRAHLISIHLSFEQIGVVELSNSCEEMIVEEYDGDNIEHEDFEENIEASETKIKPNRSFVSFPEPKRQRLNQLKVNKSPRYERLFCIDCNYNFSSQAHYQAHLNGHQLYEIVAKHSYFPICSFCNMMFCDETFDEVHAQKHQNGEAYHEAMPSEGSFLKLGQCRDDPHEEPPKGDGNLACGHCLRRFHDEESCRLHQLIFHVQILKCPIENRVFKGNQAFTIHLKNNHPELFGYEAKFLCSVCKAEFETLFDKLKHMKTCDKKKYACNHCDKKFSQKCYLSNHLRLVTGQSSVVCEICDKVCRDKGDYQIHQRSHSNIKPYQCSLCPKAYKTSSARAAHLETHNEDGFDCNFCTVKFKSRRTLHKHMKTKHASKQYETK